MPVQSDMLYGSQLTTYRIGGVIEEPYQPETMDEAIEVLTQNKDALKNGNKKFTLLGWGGNVIIASAGISGVTLITRKMNWIEYLGEKRFKFGSGVFLVKSSRAALEQSLSGGEYMIGIPGTIGGAIRMNAGALGQETCEVVKNVTLFNLDSGEIETWDNQKLDFAYRKSAIDPNRHIILEAEFAFWPGEPDAIKEKMDGSINFRKTYHPTEPSGGSVFKNPYSKDDPENGHKSCGWMLDQLGAKEWIEGGVRVSPLHANFIINHTGEGTSTDVLRLMVKMQRAIKEHYGPDVHPENLFIGDATDEERALWKELSGEDLT